MTNIERLLKGETITMKNRSLEVTELQEQMKKRKINFAIEIRVSIDSKTVKIKKI